MTSYEWMTSAACKDEETSIFFAEGRNDDRTAALFVCLNGCPVRQECLDYALRKNISDGIWGGKTEIQRTRLRHKNGRKYPAVSRVA